MGPHVEATTYTHASLFCRPAPMQRVSSVCTCLKTEAVCMHSTGTNVKGNFVFAVLERVQAELQLQTKASRVLGVCGGVAPPIAPACMD
eukprot:2426850-Alexandrium_andersonii.AAC.1